MATTYLTRTPGTGSTTKSTFSAWIKRSGLGANNDLWEIYNDGSNYRRIRFQDDNTFQLRVDVGNTTILHKISNAKYRDISGWYHVVVALDLSSGDKERIYINGERVTSFGTETNTTATSGDWVTGNSTWTWTIGRHPSGDAYWNGLVCNVHFCDGYTYAASDFGSTDATSGEWVINTSPSVNYGTNGFLILKNGNTITDQSSNSNDFTLGGGTLTDLKDCPDNVFATWNPLKSWNDSGTLRQPTYSNGNTTAIFDDSGNNEQAFSTLAVSTGKFYSEVKCTSITANANTRIGIGDINYTGTSNPNLQSTTIYYLADGNKRIGSSSSSYGNTYTTGDIISVAMDLDNNKLYFAKNGTWENSGDPTSGATGTGAIDITDGYNYCFQIEDYASSGNRSMETNFGNGYFGTTAISSEGTNASSIGKFEYDVPTGYTALSTKGLNS